MRLLSWSTFLDDLQDVLEGALEAVLKAERHLEHHPEGDSYYPEAVPWWSGDEMRWLARMGGRGDQERAVICEVR